MLLFGSGWLNEFEARRGGDNVMIPDDNDSELQYVSCLVLLQSDVAVSHMLLRFPPYKIHVFFL